MLAAMADTTTDQGAVEQDETARPIRIPRGTLAAVTRFVRSNGGSASAVIEPVGTSGVRVMMVGSESGVMGDQVVADVETARALVEAVDGLELAEWDRDLSAAATPRAGHWAKMAGWVART